MSAKSRLMSVLALSAMLILACTSAGCASGQGAATLAPASPASAAAVNSITIKNLAFGPNALTVKTGSAITWVNQDGASPTVVSDPSSPTPFTSPMLVTGASFQFTFSAPGIHLPRSVHPSMKGRYGHRKAIIPAPGSGDVVSLSTSDIIPADARLLFARDFYVNQSILTDESFPVERHAGMADKGSLLSGAKNYVFLGTSVVSGAATAVITRTGMSTEFGRVARTLVEHPPETELERGLK